MRRSACNIFNFIYILTDSWMDTHTYHMSVSIHSMILVFNAVVLFQWLLFFSGLVGFGTTKRFVDCLARSNPTA